MQINFYAKKKRNENQNKNKPSMPLVQYESMDLEFSLCLSRKKP